MPPRERPFPLEQEPIVDLKPIIAGLLAGTYAPKPELTREGLEKQLLALRAETKKSIQSPKETEELERLQVQGRRLREALKPELGALTAIVTSEIWNDPTFLEERSALLKSPLPLTQKFEYMGEIFVGATKRWFATQEKTPVPHLVPILARLKDALWYELSGAETDFFRSSGPAHIKQGIGTARQVAHNLAVMVMTKATELDERGTRLSQEQVYGAIERAYYKIGVRLASMNVNYAVPFMDALWKNPSMFELREKDGIYTLYILPDKLNTLMDEDGKNLWETQLHGETTKCPAMYGVGDHGAVIPEYFRYSLELMKSSFNQTV